MADKVGMADSRMRQNGARTACPRDAGPKLLFARTRLSALRFAAFLNQPWSQGCIKLGHFASLLPEGRKQKRQKDSRSPRRFARFESHTQFRRFWTAAVLLPLFFPSLRDEDWQMAEGDAALLTLQDEFKNRRNTRSRRGNEAELPCVQKSASLPRRLRILELTLECTRVSLLVIATRFV